MVACLTACMGAAPARPAVAAPGSPASLESRTAPQTAGSVPAPQDAGGVPNAARAPEAPRPTAPAPDYPALYAKGVSFATFLDKARARREDWRRHYSDAAVTPDLVTRMRALRGHRLMLIVAEDWCADSVNTVPYVARLVDAAPDRVDLRVIDATAGRPAMEANPAPDGRAATPTIIVLTDDGSVLGAWVERPSPAQHWFLERQKTTMQQPLHEQLMKWYDEDAGRTTMAEIAAILER